MEFLNVLSREEMKHIKGGSGGCRTLVNGTWDSSCWLTPTEAQAYYEGFEEVTAYCCASCGEPGFASAGSCDPVPGEST